MSAPRATMRLQFHKGFTFADAQSLVPYFAAIGVSHIYASPIMTARPGSMHGYDVVDPTHINPELGGEHALRVLVEGLRRHELGLILDIVPNHMATGPTNRWWVDVLAHGRNSQYAKYFDIDWHPPNPNLQGKVLLPVLGKSYGETLEAGEIKLSHADDKSRFVVRYYDHTFPLRSDGSIAPDFDSTSPQGRRLLHALLEQQHYRLAWWHTANDEINWRRFFDINDLIALRIEDDEVFDAVHGTVLRLYAEGLVDGLRIDHIDGLSQPERYCQKLRACLSALEQKRPSHSPAGPAYFVVEKIIARHEALPKRWNADGTTGYDFMDEISALQHEQAGEQPLRDFWHRVSARPGDFDHEEELARRQILERSFSAQLDAVIASIYALAQADPRTCDDTREAIRRGLIEILVHFPVYRTYARTGHMSQADDCFLRQALAKASRSCLPPDKEVVFKLGKWLSGERIHPRLDELQNVALARFQQLSAPLCAKAVEDTAFYRYGRLISRNDVGFDVRQFACSSEEFHKKMMRRAADFPHAMLATATHDHKRGEDVRARLAVLSELPQDWIRAVEGWINCSLLQCKDGEQALDPGDLAILFQTIVGAWPLDLTVRDPAGLSAYSERVAAWQQKALREAKLRSDWSVPDEVYERALRYFITQLFSGPSSLLEDIAQFAHRIAPAGAANGLAQTLAKLTVPGVPDIYQGTDYWDLSLVDPDNRTAVDFALRRKSMGLSDIADLSSRWTNGFIKQWTIARILEVRQQMPELFADGAYLPLEVTGPMAERIVAYARLWKQSVALIAFSRLNTTLSDTSGKLPISRCTNTYIRMPDALPGDYTDVLGSVQRCQIPAELPCAGVFSVLPIAFFTKSTSDSA
jgi:(1->4)-alpha-D-glucan 1-alpha-D-glucosylmutase